MPSPARTRTSPPTRPASSRVLQNQPFPSAAVSTWFVSPVGARFPGPVRRASRRLQRPQADQVERRRPDPQHLLQFPPPDHQAPPQSRDRLQPPEAFLHLLPAPLAEPIALGLLPRRHPLPGLHARPQVLLRHGRRIPRL